MKKRIILSSIVGLFLLLSIISPVMADGIIIPTFTPCPPEGDCSSNLRPMTQLAIRYHHVTVKIEDQLAVTHVDQVFHNPNNYPVEGIYVFPLPLDAAVSNFTLWIDGKPVEGKVLDAETARLRYEEVVRQMRDPALLEYIGRGAVQASIFPIPPDGERRIELEYSQVLIAENGLVGYSYPLNTEKFSVKPLESVSVTLEISAKTPVRAVYSPSHNIDMDRKDSRLVRVSYEDHDITPDKDFSIYYSIGNREALHYFSYRDSTDLSDPDGFFMLLLAPKQGDVDQIVDKDVILVLDRSGSMEGEKFSQAQSALKYILNNLNRKDRFYLASFSTGMEYYANNLRYAEEAQDAIAWVDRLSAAGSTDINRALLEAASVAEKERPTYLIFLTDGLPTTGVTDSNKILNNFERQSPDNLRLFTFGVGYDVDTFLLDSLSQEHHGLSTYVKPGEPLDEILSGFYSRISTPVLTNLRIDYGKLNTYDIYPNPLPDLFSGSQIVVVGRYRKGGTDNIQLQGMINNEMQTNSFEDITFTENSRGKNDASANLPRLWATRKVGYLLNKIRLQGADQETINQIIKLSIRYGIVTPYTSYLVTEPMALSGSTQEEMAREAYDQIQAAPSMVPSGEQAVQKAEAEGAMSQAQVAPAMPSEAEQKVRNVGSRTFVLSNGVWMDTTYDPDKMTTVPVALFSPDYFSLAASREDIGSALALGGKVILVIDGKAYEVVGEDAPAAPINRPTNTPDSEGISGDAVPVLTNHSTEMENQPDSTIQPGASFPGVQWWAAALPCAIYVAGGGGLIWLLVKFLKRRSD